VVHSKKEGDIYTILKKKASKAKPQEKINFKEYLLQEIVNNNIWTDEDLNTLFESTRTKYPDHDKALINEAILYVKSTIL